MKDYHVSVSMEPENDNQGREIFRWELIRYEKKRGFKYPAVHKQGSAYSRRDALNEGIRAYDTLLADLSRSVDKNLSVQNMFINKDFEGLRALADDPIESAELSCDSLLCVIFAVAFKKESYQVTEELLKRFVRMNNMAGEIIRATSMALITDERLGSSSNATELHKLAQICNLLAVILSINDSPSHLIRFFDEASRIWRQRAIKPPVHTGEELVMRAHDFMELGEKDKAKENIMKALSKGLKGDTLIKAGRMLSQVGQYKLAEEAYVKGIDNITDEAMRKIIQEKLDWVRTELAKSEYN